MPHGIKGWTFLAAAQVVFTVIVHFVVRLADNAMLTWIDGQIACFFGFSQPYASTVISWVVVALVVFVMITAYHAVQSRISNPKIHAANASSSPLQSPEFEQIQSLYNSWLYPAAENINQVMQRVMIAVRKHPDAAVRSHGSLIQRSIVDEERAALSRLSNALGGIEPTPDTNLQERLGGYYRNYQNNRTWVAGGMKLTGLRLARDSIFQEWRRLDADFLRELRRLSGPPCYDRLRQLIQEVGWGETVTCDIESAP